MKTDMVDQTESKRIIEVLPHQPPFLRIDRVVILEKEKKIVFLTGISADDPFLSPHRHATFMPGLLIIEAVVQASALLRISGSVQHRGPSMVLSSIERANFRRPILPGDQVRVIVEVIASRPTAAQIRGRAYIRRALACDVLLMCQLVG